MAQPVRLFSPAMPTLNHYNQSFVSLEIVVFTINEHENISIAGLNCRAGYGVDYLPSMEGPKTQHVIIFVHMYICVYAWCVLFRECQEICQVIIEKELYIEKILNA